MGAFMGRGHGQRPDRHPDTVCRILYWLEGDEVRLISILRLPNQGGRRRNHGVDVNTGILWVRCFRETGKRCAGPFVSWNDPRGVEVIGRKTDRPARFYFLA